MTTTTRPDGRDPDRTPRRHHAEPGRVGVYSVCSAHPWVLAAAVDPGARGRHRRADRGDLQPGRPGRRLHRHAAGRLPRPRARHRPTEHGLPPSGSCWVVTTSAPTCGARWARTRRCGGPRYSSRRTSRRASPRSTSTASMACAGEPDPLPDDVVAERAARLARAAEAAAGPGAASTRLRHRHRGAGPGWGARDDRRARPDHARRAARTTIEAHRAAFAAAGLDDAWRRVIAVVVQPGVEFDHQRVFDYDPAGVRELRAVVEEHAARLRGALHRLPAARRACGRSSRTTGPCSRSGRG